MSGFTVLLLLVATYVLTYVHLKPTEKLEKYCLWKLGKKFYEEHIDSNKDDTPQ